MATQISRDSSSQLSSAEPDAPLKDAVKQAKNFLKARSRDLRGIPVPHMQDALGKLIETLSRCKKAKTIGAFITRINTVERVILQPILTQYRTQNVGLTEHLYDQLRDVFNKISDAVSKNLPPRKVTSPFRKVDLEGPLGVINSVIDENMTVFQRNGDVVVVRVRSRPDGPERAQLDVRTIEDAQIPSGDSDLEPHVKDILRICPKFRILLLGKSGVGKSSLINKVFNIETAEVSHHRAGRADINTEFVSPQNRHFILHDSCGFEYGAADQLAAVKDFITARVKSPRASEQLHAVWLCLGIPMGGARLLDFADEAILQMDMGDVPLIIVFTKYDKLVSDAEDFLDVEMDRANPACPVLARAREQYRQICVRRLEASLDRLRARRAVKCSQYVSVREGHDETVSALIRVTAEHVGGNVQAAWAIAQRFDAQTSRDASINIGRQKYWATLSQSVYFAHKPLQSCLWTLHVDIVTTWNFFDPENCLQSKSMMNLLATTIAELADHSDPHAALRSGLAAAQQIGDSLSNIPTVGTVATPVASLALLGQWIYGVYERTPGVLQCLMAYIIDLNFLLWDLFWIMRKKGGLQPITQEIWETALDKFVSSVQRMRIHASVRIFVKDMPSFGALHRDVVLEEVIRLIKEFLTDGCK